MPPRATVIVPARLASTRLPEKVLLSRTGKPMVQHVVEQALRAQCAASVVVATDSQRVIDALAPFNTRCILTRPDHPNGTSRLAQAAAILALAPGDIVVNAQGDEPEMPPAVIDAAVDALLQTPHASIGTVCTPFAPGEDPANPNIVKVVPSQLATALYFSRAHVPFCRDGTPQANAQPLRHVGVYAYRAGFLHTYANLPSTPLEICESLEQLRALELGYTIGLARCDQAKGLTGIDTAEQYEEFVARRGAKRQEGIGNRQ